MFLDGMAWLAEALETQGTRAQRTEMRKARTRLERNAKSCRRLPVEMHYSLAIAGDPVWPLPPPPPPPTQAGSWQPLARFGKNYQAELKIEPLRGRTVDAGQGGE